jgi:hypothetical protein
MSPSLIPSDDGSRLSTEPGLHGASVADALPPPVCDMRQLLLLSVTVFQLKASSENDDDSADGGLGSALYYLALPGAVSLVIRHAEMMAIQQRVVQYQYRWSSDHVITMTSTGLVMVADDTDGKDNDVIEDKRIHFVMLTVSLDLAPQVGSAWVILSFVYGRRWANARSVALQFHRSLTSSAREYLCTVTCQSFCSHTSVRTPVAPRPRGEACASGLP